MEKEKENKNPMEKRKFFFLLWDNLNFLNLFISCEIMKYYNKFVRKDGGGGGVVRKILLYDSLTAGEVTVVDISEVIF